MSLQTKGSYKKMAVEFGIMEVQSLFFWKGGLVLFGKSARMLYFDVFCASLCQDTEEREFVDCF